MKWLGAYWPQTAQNHQKIKCNTCNKRCGRVVHVINLFPCAIPVSCCKFLGHELISCTKSNLIRLKTERKVVEYSHA